MSYVLIIVSALVAPAYAGTYASREACFKAGDAVRRAIPPGSVIPNTVHLGQFVDALCLETGGKVTP